MNEGKHFEEIDVLEKVFPSHDDLSDAEVDKILGGQRNQSPNAITTNLEPEFGPPAPTEIRASIAPNYTVRNDIVKTIPDRLLTSLGRLAKSLKLQ